jgi:hypothetical protein
MERTATLAEPGNRVRQIFSRLDALEAVINQHETEEANKQTIDRQTQALERIADALELFAECITTYGWSGDPKIRVDTGEFR